MDKLPWSNPARFISEATTKIYNTYLSHEPPRIILSFALTLLINVIDMMDNKEQAMDEVFRTLESYEDQMIHRSLPKEEIE